MEKNCEARLNVTLIKIHGRLEFTYIEWLETDPEPITW